MPTWIRMRPWGTPECQQFLNGHFFLCYNVTGRLACFSWPTMELDLGWGFIKARKALGGADSCLSASCNPKCGHDLSFIRRAAVLLDTPVLRDFRVSLLLLSASHVCIHKDPVGAPCQAKRDWMDCIAVTRCLGIQFA